MVCPGIKLHNKSVYKRKKNEKAVKIKPLFGKLVLPFHISQCETDNLHIFPSHPPFAIKIVQITSAKLVDLKRNFKTEYILLTFSHKYC